MSYLCKEIGISRTHLYHLKNGKQEPTAKIWGLLEASERAAGIGSKPHDAVLIDNPPPAGNAQSTGKVKDSGADGTEKIDPKDPEALLALFPEAMRMKAARMLATQMLAGAEDLAAEFFLDAEALASVAGKAAGMIEDLEMKTDLLYFSKTVGRNVRRVMEWHSMLSRLAGDSWSKNEE